jgi:hypothetical protein
MFNPPSPKCAVSSEAVHKELEQAQLRYKHTIEGLSLFRKTTSDLSLVPSAAGYTSRILPN